MQACSPRLASVSDIRAIPAHQNSVLFRAKLSVQLRCPGYFWHCPKVAKRLGAGRGAPRRLVRLGVFLCFSPKAGRRELAHPCARTCAPCSRFRLRCSAPRTAPLIHYPVHPWTTPRKYPLRAGCALLLVPFCIAAAAAAMREAAARWIAPIPLRAHGCALSGTQAS